MRRSYIILLLLAVIILGVIVGIFISNKDNAYNLKQTPKEELASKNVESENDIKTIATTSLEIKTSPNCLFVFDTYYKECGHTIKEKQKISENDVNKTQEELKIKYKDWDIKKFDISEVTFYKEENNICNEHYIIKDNNGYIEIYTIDNKGNENLEEKTEILTTYLPEIDKENLKKGIQIIGREKLNLTIENYE